VDYNDDFKSHIEIIQPNWFWISLLVNRYIGEINRPTKWQLRGFTALLLKISENTKKK